MTKPTSVKFSKEMLADIDEQCEGLGCNRTDFIRHAVEEKLQESTNETEGQVISDIKPEPKEKPKVVINLDDPPKPEPTIKEAIKEIPQDNSNKPPVQMAWFNDKLLPFAKRYNL